MKHLFKFEAYISESSVWHVDPSTLVFDEAEDAYRDPVSGKFGDPNTGNLFVHKSAKDLPIHWRRLLSEIEETKIDYPIELPEGLEGCRSKYDVGDAVRAGKISEPEINEFIDELWLDDYLTAHDLSIGQIGRMKKLYHATPHKTAALIRANGFQLTKGTRNMGAHILGGIVDYDVQNRGIFLSDNYRLAEYFGVNRAGGGRNDADVLVVRAALNRTIDLTSAEACQDDIRADVQSTYKRINENVFKKDNIWEIVDDEQFINAAMDKGYDSVVFKESKDVLRDVGDASALTYLVFDPDRLYLVPDMLRSAYRLDFLAKYLETGIIDKKTYK